MQINEDVDTRQIKAIELSVMNLCLLTGLYKSRSEAKRDIVGGGIYINGDRINDPQYTLCEGDLLYGKYVLFRKGKNAVRIMELKHTCDINEKETLYETIKYSN